MRKEYLIMENFKSPLKKLTVFFKKSRDKWKGKCKQAMLDIRSQKKRIEFLETSKAELKSQLRKLKTQNKQLQNDLNKSEGSKKKSEKLDTEIQLIKNERNRKTTELTNRQNNLFYHHYSATQIFYFISLVMAAIGLRASSRVIDISARIFGIDMSIPSWYSGRLWLMRLGYYKLNRAKIKSDDWIWIIDHSVQIGAEKCLVILGIRLSDLPIGRSLTYEDVEPIELVPVTKSNGEIVYEQLNSAAEKTGVPTVIVADKGSDIKSGIDRFCADNQDTRYIYDIKHALANLLKKTLENCNVWKMFISLCRFTKNCLQQTELAYLSPPNQKSKSRYMNIETLVNWGSNIIILLENKNTSEKICEKLGWVNTYRFAITRWSHMICSVSCTENFIRNNGVHTNAHLDLTKALEELNLPDHADTFNQKIIMLVEKESSYAKPQERLLGSSEIIESLFGKQKNIEKQHAKNGFTGLLLSLAACVSKTTTDVIKNAMESVKTKSVIEWYKTNIGKSVQAKRLSAFRSKKTPDESEQKVYQELIVTTG
jgi:hypothetical protein